MRLGESRDELVALRASLRERLAATPLFDGTRFVPGFEALLLEPDANSGP